MTDGTETESRRTARRRAVAALAGLLGVALAGCDRGEAAAATGGGRGGPNRGGDRITPVEIAVATLGEAARSVGLFLIVAAACAGIALAALMPVSGSLDEALALGAGYFEFGR